jgi:phage terminase large subunit GpA-like protein
MDFPTLDLARFKDVVRPLLADLLPPERVSVTEWSIENRRIKGRAYDPARAPHVAWIQDQIGSGRYRRATIMGPSQCYKSTVAENVLAYETVYDPANALWIQTDRGAMHRYSTQRIDDLIHGTESLKALLRDSQDAENKFNKRFVSGAEWVFGWPVVSFFRAGSYRLIVLDDYDAFPDTIDDEGDPLKLVESRYTIFSGRELVLVVSSPAKGADAGVEALAATGTDHRFGWRCPECGAPFEASFAHLDFERTDDPDEAAATAVMVCPNGHRLPPSAKLAMLQSLFAFARTQKIGHDGSVLGPEPETDHLSVRIDGVVGALAWPVMAKRCREAELVLERKGDHEPLMAFYNTTAGWNYSARDAKARAGMVDDDASLTAEILRRRRESWQLGEVPSGVAALIASVDVQSNRFEVMVTGVGEGFERWVVDRYSIATDASGRVSLAPFSIPEHWQVLKERVIDRVYPLAGGVDRCMPVLATAIDIGGADDGTENARLFAEWALKEGVEKRRVMLVKGGTLLRGPIIDGPRPFTVDQSGRPMKAGVAFWLLTVNRIKTMIMGSLARAGDGAGAIHFPDDFADAWFDELLAEERDDKGRWVNQRANRRNETLDLMVYALACVHQLSAGRTGTDWVPHWARARDGLARAQTSTAQPVARLRPQTKPDRAAVLARYREQLHG